MLVSGAGDIKLTKDGNTLLHEVQVQHPTAMCARRLLLLLLLLLLLHSPPAATNTSAVTTADAQTVRSLSLPTDSYLVPAPSIAAG